MTDIIKSGTKAIALHKATNYAIIALLVVAALFYVYLVNMAVRTLTVLEKTKEGMQSLSVEISEMESKRFASENSLSKEKALRLGFVEVENPTFIMKGSRKAALSLKTD